MTARTTQIRTARRIHPRWHRKRPRRQRPHCLAKPQQQRGQRRSSRRAGAEGGAEGAEGGAGGAEGAEGGAEGAGGRGEEAGGQRENRGSGGAGQACASPGCARPVCEEADCARLGLRVFLLVLGRAGGATNARYSRASQPRRQARSSTPPYVSPWPDPFEQKNMSVSCC